MCFAFEPSVLGQSDIKKLLRENYRLRTENWTLRDEYDRLDKLLKSKSRPNGHSTKESHDYRNDFKYGCDYDDSYRCYNCLVDEVSTEPVLLSIVEFWWKCGN